jgi:hypothetical protein
VDFDVPDRLWLSICSTLLLARVCEQDIDDDTSLVRYFPFRLELPGENSFFAQSVIWVCGIEFSALLGQEFSCPLPFMLS